MAYNSPAASYTTYNTYQHSPGRNAHIFQPPQSPATPLHATATDYFSIGSRKRARPESVSQVRPAITETPSWVQCPTPGDGSYTSALGNSGYGRNSMLVNERYRLAGGLDTPGLQATAEMEQSHMDPHVEERRWRGDTSSHLPMAETSLSGPLMRERNGIARMPSYSNGEATRGWADLAFSLVGKVFQLSTTVFRGFYAGGGQGYDIKHSPLQNMWRGPPEACSTPLPGSWHQDEFLGDFEQDNLLDQTVSRPAVKRRQTGQETWVMVGTPDVDGMSGSPRRKSSSAQVPTLSSLRPSASRASSRRSLLPLPRRQSHQPPTTTTYHYNAASPSQIPVPASGLSPTRRASLAPMRRLSSTGSNPATAYISPEAEKYVKRRQKNEKQADATMSDLSRKLAELIRQGQEALGTRFEVEGGGEEAEEGWA